MPWVILTYIIYYNNLEINTKWIKEKEFSYEWGYEAVKDIFSEKSKPHPEVIFSSAWFLTGGILKYIDEKEIKVPEDLKIISFDDYPFIKYLKYPLITIKQDTETMGKTAFLLLLKMLKGEKIESQRIKTSIKIY